MPLTDTAVVLPGTGHYLVRDVTASPTQPTLAEIEAFASDTSDLPTGFTNYGHTDRDEPVSFGQDGGESEVKGSWQNASLREIVTSTSTDYMVVKHLQLRDPEVLADYYGGGTAGTDVFSLPDNPVPQEREVLVVMFDANGPLALWLPKTSIRREDSLEVSTDDFVKVPLRMTFLKNGSLPKARWIGDGVGTA